MKILNLNVIAHLVMKANFVKKAIMKTIIEILKFKHAIFYAGPCIAPNILEVVYHKNLPQ